MTEFLTSIMPNVMDRLPDFYQAIGDTLIMVGWSGSIAFVLGLFLGIVLSDHQARRHPRAERGLSGAG